MIISMKGLNLIKQFEGCRLTAYQDSIGVWTIGWGTTNYDKGITGITIQKGTVITQDQADRWLVESVKKKYCAAVDKYMGTGKNKYNFNVNQYWALVSFAYNVGNIDQLTDNGTRTIAEISAAMPKYNKSGGKVINGLTERRLIEQKLFNTKPFDFVTFIKEVQAAIGAKVDGVAGNETLSKTITVSASVNNKHSVVRSLQKYFNAYGYDCGTVDGIAGSKFAAAVKLFQNMNSCVADGEITARKKTWQTILDYFADVESKKVNYLNKCASGAKIAYADAMGCTHNGANVGKVTSLATLKKYKTLTCNRVSSIALQLGGCLDEGVVVGHTTKKDGKKTIKDAVYNSDKLKHGVIKWFNKLYKDLPEECRKPGCAYYYNSDSAIAGPNGTIYSCNEGHKQMTNGVYTLTCNTSGYCFTSKILAVFIPDGD